MNLQEGCRGKLSHQQNRKRYFPFWQHQRRWWALNLDVANLVVTEDAWERGANFAGVTHSPG